jgi:hypothetical protein
MPLMQDITQEDALSHLAKCLALAAYIDAAIREHTEQDEETELVRKFLKHVFDQCRVFKNILCHIILLHLPAVNSNKEGIFLMADQMVDTFCSVDGECGDRQMARVMAAFEELDDWIPREL